MRKGQDVECISQHIKTVSGWISWSEVKIFSCAYPSKEEENLSLLMSGSAWGGPGTLRTCCLLHSPCPRLLASEEQRSGVYKSSKRGLWWQVYVYQF